GLADWHALAGDLNAAARGVRALAHSLGAPGRWGWGAEAPQGVDSLAWSGALEALVPPLEDAAAALGHASEHVPDLERLLERCDSFLALVRRFGEPCAGESVRWLDLSASELRLVESPHDIASALQGRLMGLPESADAAAKVARAWIFTSATLGDDERLSWFTDPCGLAGARILRVGSPFDYAVQAGLYVPEHLPPPAHEGHSLSVAEWVAPVAERLAGRTLVLTTSLRALRTIGTALRELLLGQGGVEVLVQGESPKRWLMDRFRAGNSQGQRGCVLVASASFWEGFDVPGDMLQLVVIDKLPFPSPGDPLVKARSERVEQSGRSAFAHHAVPEAAMALKQGAGRLIRSESDRGILVVCDRRLTTMGYGKRLLRALPPMRRLPDAQAFDEALAVLTTFSTTTSIRP
ncbi:MAG: ATP-dependent DNA helicase, partial [Giesbergeria sp.]